MIAVYSIVFSWYPISAPSCSLHPRAGSQNSTFIRKWILALFLKLEKFIYILQLCSPEKQTQLWWPLYFYICNTSAYINVSTSLLNKERHMSIAQKYEFNTSWHLHWVVYPTVNTGNTYIWQLWPLLFFPPIKPLQIVIYNSSVRSVTYTINIRRACEWSKKPLWAIYVIGSPVFAKYRTKPYPLTED